MIALTYSNSPFERSECSRETNLLIVWDLDSHIGWTSVFFWYGNNKPSTISVVVMGTEVLQNVLLFGRQDGLVGLMFFYLSKFVQEIILREEQSMMTDYAAY